MLGLLTESQDHIFGELGVLHDPFEVVDVLGDIGHVALVSAVWVQAVDPSVFVGGPYWYISLQSYLFNQFYKLQFSFWSRVKKLYLVSIIYGKIIIDQVPLILESEALLLDDNVWVLRRDEWNETH